MFGLQVRHVVLGVLLRQRAARMVGQLPDPHCTPGDEDHSVTQDNIHQTICRSGWSTSVRPPVSVTEPMKLQLMAAYGMAGVPLSTVTLDHLVPLEVSGATDQANLWPEPADQARTKDLLENRLHQLVCDGQVSLADAVHAIASDWVGASARYLS